MYDKFLNYTQEKRIYLKELLSLILLLLLLQYFGHNLEMQNYNKVI